MTFENWQIAHFRILGNDKYTPYGTSVLDPGRRIWRQLVLMEDAMMAYRIVRSSERRVFYIDVGNIAPQDVETFVQKTVTSMKRNQVVDDRTGRVDLRYNPLSVEEDYFIPVRGGESSKIESLPGGQFTGDIDDVKYLRDKMFSALKIPAAYLSSGEEGAAEDKTTLAQKDVRFARTIQRLQRAVIAELEKIGIVHLYTLGFRGDDLVSFRLKLNNPSKIAELQELEHWKQKFDIAGGATENFFSRRWIAQHIFSLSEEEFVRNQREMFHDRKYEAELNAAAEVAGEQAASEFGGNIESDLTDLADDEGIDLSPTEDEDLDLDVDTDTDTDTEDPLLAAPARRRDDRGRTMTTTRKSKSYYTPKGNGRGGDNRSGRQHHLRALTNPPQDIIPGSKELKSLSRGITVAESNQNKYRKVESDIFETSMEVRKLISELEKTENKSNEDETQQKA